jgi:hypothetical protein
MMATGGGEAGTLVSRVSSALKAGMAALLAL